MALQDGDGQGPLTGLHDIRLPVDAAGGAFSDIAAALAVGLMLALCLAPVIRALTRPRTSGPRPGPVVAALDGLEGEPRRRALLRLVAEHRPDVLRAMEPEIYRRGGLPPTEPLEAALRGGPR